MILQSNMIHWQCQLLLVVFLRVLFVFLYFLGYVIPGYVSINFLNNMKSQKYLHEILLGWLS